MTLSIDLSGKKALVTGASSGIGAEIAFTLAQAGADVAIVGRDESRLRETSERIEEAGGKVVKIAADLTADGAAEKVVAETVFSLGGLTTLVHSAGIFEVIPMIEGVESLDRALAINIRAPYALTSAALPHLRGGGAVVFVSSIGGHVGFPGCTAYGASKGAIEALVKSLAVEEAPNGVRVAAVAPGNIRTPINAHLFTDPEYLAQELALTPAGRIGEVQDIAPAVAFLASNHASYVTGTSLVIDGGVVAG
ncbi:SDR family NAD(P)-dependent oxidoreductase [Rhodococcus wratislaviensis]|uniref:Putative oxidoreductase n=1 Tax=Rhodococcus wratislaviensis NBRC 100605 TaxID=1219028 RepID=X0QYI1_RHOWR|nr:SDR family NAD(P)-dependent oxidoreductase [Rhodococcus wratislaviensis]GAF43675.1 putative oxidoreductase [Rhodococcus wratislaviensis NBRC 100605]